MKRCLFYYTCLSLLAVIHSAVFAAPNARSLSTGNLHFIENKGQITDQYDNPRPDIDFKIAAGNGLNVFIGAGHIHYQWSKTIENGKPQTEQEADANVVTEMYRMDVILLNVNPNAEIVTAEPQPYYERYYLPHTGEDGATAHAWRKITYKEVYPHIDWVFYINPQGRVEHDFIVRPGGKVSDIRLQYAGATQMRLNEDGSVTATTPFGSVTENTPYCFQQDGREVAAKFLLNGNTLSFSTAVYEGILTIDPVLEWATYYGGDNTDVMQAITTNVTGDVFMTGYTQSTANMVTTGSYQQTLSGSEDAFLLKFGASGQCHWGTYFGGTSVDRSSGISLDTAGNVYIAGYTKSTADIATRSSHQATHGGNDDAFLAKFDSAGQRLWATYYGGSSADQGKKVACDGSGYVYLSGHTSSTSGIATTGSHQDTRGGSSDAFLVKFDGDGLRQWGTYYGGSSADMGTDVTCDRDGSIYITGYTKSAAAIATTGSHQTTNAGGDDVFLAKFSGMGNLLWGTYYGGGAIDQAYAITTDTAANIYIAGTTTSTTGIAAAGGHQPAFGGGNQSDAFLAGFDGHGQIKWSTYYGGELADNGSSVSCDPFGNVWLCGSTKSEQNIATPDAYKNTFTLLTDVRDAYAVKFDSTGVRVWATYFGTSTGDEQGIAIRCDEFGNVYFGGHTTSISGISTPGSHQEVYGGNGATDAFLSRWNDCGTPQAPDTIAGEMQVCRSGSYMYAVPALPGAVSYTWTLPAGWSGSSTGDSIMIQVGYTGSTDTIRVSANYLCGSSPTQALAVQLNPEAAITPSGLLNLCAGDSIILHGNNDADLDWKWLQNGSMITGVADSVYTIRAQGEYRLIVTAFGRCTDTSDEVILIVHPLPQPAITVNGSELSTGEYDSYQWSRKGQPIMGATGRAYTMIIPDGDYTVTVTDSNGCMNTAPSYTPETGIAHVAKQTAVTIYPNPGTGKVYIQGAENIAVAISSYDGKEVMRVSYTDHIDATALSDGIYLLQVWDKDGHLIAREKWVKTAIR